MIGTGTVNLDLLKLSSQDGIGVVRDTDTILRAKARLLEIWSALTIGLVVSKPIHFYGS